MTEERLPTILLVLTGLLVAAVAALGLFATEAVLALDQRLYLAIRGTGAGPAGPPKLGEIIRDITALGSYTVAGAVTVVAVVALYLGGRWRDAVFVATTVAGGVIVAALLKELFGRPRPDLFEHFHHVATLSFPSGHAAKSALVYLTLATIAGSLTSNRGLRIFGFVVAGTLVIAVGLSRIYLGVHWPSDVVAGWIFGVGWVLMAVVVAHRATTRRNEGGRTAGSR
jgi:undecaprenyl-diphosphatase